MDNECHSDSDCGESYTVVSSVSLISIIDDKERKTCFDLRAKEWSHLLISLVNNFAHIAFAVYLMSCYSASSSHYVVSTIHLIKLFFVTFFLFHGLFKEQPFQIFMQVVTVGISWALDLIYFLAFDDAPYESNGTEYSATLIIFICFIASTVISVVNVITGLMVAWQYHSMEKAIFVTVGTNLSRVQIFRNLFFGFSLLFLDLETNLLALFLFMRNGYVAILIQEILVICLGAAFLTVWLIIGYKAIRNENQTLTWIFCAVSLAQPVYIIVLFIRNLMFWKSSDNVLTWSTFFICVLSLAVHLSLLAVLVSIQHNYGKGYGDVLVDGVHHSVKNSEEYEDLRRTLFHPVYPSRAQCRHTGGGTTSNFVTIQADVY